MADPLIADLKVMFEIGDRQVLIFDPKSITNIENDYTDKYSFFPFRLLLRSCLLYLLLNSRF
jgi:hypothetical protein